MAWTKVPAADRGRALLLAVAAGLPLLMGGCGQEGKTGSPGTPGTSPPPPPTDTTLKDGQALPGVKLAIISLSGGGGAGGSFRAGDGITVHFTLQKDDGSDLGAGELDASSIYVSGPTFNYNRVIAATDGWHTAATRNSDGSYSYRIPAAIPASYLAPCNDTATYGAGDGELQGRALLDGTYTVGMECTKYYSEPNGNRVRDVGNATRDFLVGVPAGTVAREVVKVDNCNRCHVTLQAHEGTRRDTRLCVLCHTSGAEDGAGALIDFRVMIHKIHNAAHLPSVLGVTTDGAGARDYTATPVPYAVAGEDFSAINFPVWPSLGSGMPRDLGYSALSTAAKSQETVIQRGVVACDKCHGGAAQGDFCYLQPSRRACGSCHDDVVWAHPYASNGATMAAQPDDSGCAACHTATGATWEPASDQLPSDRAHRHPVNDPAINTGLKFDLTSVTGGTGPGGNFQAGDPVVIDFTLKDDANADIPASTLDSCSVSLVGPTTNLQYVLPNTSANPFDAAGRLASASSSNKAAMTKGVGATATETLTVVFSNDTDFTVTGSVSGVLGSGSLGGATGGNPSGSSITYVELAPAAVAQQISVIFTSAVTYTVNGSVSGALGSGTLPASTSAATRFISSDSSLAFDINVGSTAFSGFPVYMYLAVFEGAPNAVKFAIIGGRTAMAAGDRFYCEVVDAATTAYSYHVPMDLTLEFLGDGDGNPGQVLTAANAPVYYGRQTVYERTATSGGSTALAADASAYDRIVSVASVAGFAKDDYIVLEDGVAGKEEYVQVSAVDAVLGRITFRTPLRYAHASTSPLKEVTLTFRQEGVNYTLAPGAGAVTSLVAFGSGNAVVMSYRTDARFGWKRDVADAYQAGYQAVIGSSSDYDESWGKWTGLSFQSGTYTVGISGYKNLNVGLQNETQRYRSASLVAKKDILYGTASAVTPYALYSSQNNCNACHTDVLFHGGGRRGVDACLFCHGEAGAQLSSGETVNFRTLLHKIHRGRDLANASTFLGGDFAEVGFPAMPGGTKHCATCHGSSNTAWKEPAERKHASQTTPTRAWRAVCGSCHDSTSTWAHIQLSTGASGTEACATCHGPGAAHPVELRHRTR